VVELLREGGGEAVVSQRTAAVDPAAAAAVADPAADRPGAEGPADAGEAAAAVPAGTHRGAAVAAGDAEGLQVAVPTDVDARGRQVADTEGRMRGQKRTTSGG